MYHMENTMQQRCGQYLEHLSPGPKLRRLNSEFRFFLRLVVLGFSVAVLINVLYSSGVERNNGDGRDTAMRRELSTSWQECGRILARTGALTGGIWTNEKRKKCSTRKLAAPLSKWCGTPINCLLAIDHGLNEVYRGRGQKFCLKEKGTSREGPCRYLEVQETF
ncbi:hypothetical protein FOXB_12252 [Fusarium oxysporum f. sp. conglutinans Fo5176]|uniref:Uncharacterized protein n=1 Tax=Fusarium oxysporum (strain Fo5176) TaxID=660025 RepID=F9G0S0_FUSOF|nr:hypothetical protein FOXB_12252 [Fusarium oxysporum f. sp. conglutinans Fo5176]